MLGTVSTRLKVALVVALSFAALSLVGADPVAMVLVALSLVVSLVVLYLVVRCAVGAGILDFAARGARSRDRGAIDILDERYAREIGREGYRRTRQDLEGM